VSKQAAAREVAMDDCIFCKIARGEMKTTAVYEDEDLVAFKDVHPQAPIHVLIVPRKHIAHLAAAGPGDAVLLGKLLAVCRQLAERFSFSQCGFRVVINSGPDAGQAVDHLHVHLLGGRKFGWPPG
jgi:histidine triad (HIT) family protein